MPSLRLPCFTLFVALMVVGAVAPAWAHPAHAPAAAPAVAGPAGWREPVDLADAVARLAAARARLAATGRVPLRYTEAQLRAMAKAGDLGNTRYLVRIVPAAPGENALLGFPRPFGKLPLWVATFEQLEAADTDPEVIARLLGLNLDPAASYHVLVLRDLGADAARRPELVCPTRAKIAELAARDLTNAAFGAADFTAVLAKDYRIPYHHLMDDFYKRGFKEYIPDDVDHFIATTPALKDDAAAQKRFRARIRVHAQFGVSEWFRGNGATFMTGGGARELGVHEIFLLDPDPKPIGTYVSQGRLAIVPCKPLVKPGPLVFLEPDGRP